MIVWVVALVAVAAISYFGLNAPPDKFNLAARAILVYGWIMCGYAAARISFARDPNTRENGGPGATPGTWIYYGILFLGGFFTLGGVLLDDYLEKDRKR